MQHVIELFLKINMTLQQHGSKLYSFKYEIYNILPLFSDSYCIEFMYLLAYCSTEKIRLMRFTEEGDGWHFCGRNSVWLSLSLSRNWRDFCWLSGIGSLHICCRLVAEYTNQSKHTFDLFILQTKSFNRRSRLSMPVRVDKDSGRFTTVSPYISEWTHTLSWTSCQ